jgi:plasmid stabilization system protein ParE
MAKEVILTPRAEQNFVKIVAYLTYKWGPSVTNNFIDRFEHVLILLAEDPGMFQFADRVKRVQKCLVTKHNILYFKEFDEVIKIITIFDTRQDPQKLKDVI